MPRYENESELRQADFSDRHVDDLTDQERQELNRRFKEFVSAMKGQLPAAAPAEAPRKTVRKWNPTAGGKPSKWVR